MSDEIYSQLPLRPPGLPQNMNFLDSTQRAVDNITFLDMSAKNLALKCSFSFGRNSSLKLAESFNATLSARTLKFSALILLSSFVNQLDWIGMVTVDHRFR